MPEPVCICCYDPVTAENGDPLYLQVSVGAPDAQPVAWVHKDCLADYAMPSEIGDLPQSNLDAVRDYARSSRQ